MFGGGSTPPYRSAPDSVSLVDYAVASGTAQREVNASPDYTVGASYQTTRPTRITGIRFWWLRAAANATENVKLSLWDRSGIRLATVTVTVGCDGPQVAYFTTPVDLPAYSRIIATMYFATGHSKVLLNTSLVQRPSFGGGGGSSGSVSTLAGPGLLFDQGAQYVAGDAFPLTVNDYVTVDAIWPVEPIVEGTRNKQTGARHLWIEGDSISVGVGVGTPSIGVAYHSALGLPPGSTVVNKAVASRTLVANANNNTGSTNNIADNLAACLAAYDATAPRDIIIFGGTNDDYFASDAPTILTGLDTILSTIHTGCPLDRLWVITAIARNNWSTSPVYLGTAAAHNAILTAYNAGIPAVAALYGARVIDAAAAVQFQTPSNTTYFQGDLCHPTWRGQYHLAHLVRRALSLI